MWLYTSTKSCFSFPFQVKHKDTESKWRKSSKFLKPELANITLVSVWPEDIQTCHRHLVSPIFCFDSCLFSFFFFFFLTLNVHLTRIKFRQCVITTGGHQGSRLNGLSDNWVKQNEYNFDNLKLKVTQMWLKYTLNLSFSNDTLKLTWKFTALRNYTLVQHLNKYMVTVFFFFF